MKKTAHPPTYRSWQMMKNRCLNPKAEDFAYYGARGITTPEAWTTYEGFVFDMGLRPAGTTLDRRNGTLSYSKQNCRWATRETQSRNREYTLDLTHEGLTLKSWEWAVRLNVQPKTIHHRLWRFKNGAITYAAVFAANPRATS